MIILLGAELKSTGWLAIQEGAEYVMAKVKVDGREGLFVVDTGSSHTIFSPDFAKELNMGAGMYTSTASDGIGVQSIRFYEPKALIFENGFKLLPTLVGVYEVMIARKKTGEPVVGIIGIDTLRQSVLDFDFARSQFRICSEVDGELDEMKNQYIRRRGRDDLFVLDSKLEGVGLDLSLDSGSNAFLEFREDAFNQFSSRGMLGEVYSTETTTSFGTYLVKTSHFTRGEFMGLPLRGVSTGTNQPYGVIGLGFMRCFRMAFDVSNSRLYYKARTDSYKGELQTPFMLGASIWHLKEGAMINVLDHRSSKTPLVRIGAKEGDVISQLGEYSGEKITAVAVYNVCQRHAGKEVPIKLTRKGKLVYSGPLKLNDTIYDFDLE